ncbi:MAG TPA: M56 family metallopeptidase [Vicinamibacterales bacterium]|jgi:HEAT repeat protein/beta-lactamase regulating signal transducer with metallopeptidase domain|nr:M56 family metallopeptidase [Vicinamibacterales bacterium]
MITAQFPVSWLPLADSVIKATLVLAAAAVATHWLRRAPAAMRHLIWTLALVSALLMPVLSLALPRLPLPILTLQGTGAGITEHTTPPATVGRGSAPQLGRASAEATGVHTAAPERSGSLGSSMGSWVPALSWPRVLLFVWAAGAILILGRLLLGLVAVQWMARGSQRVLDAPWMKMAIALASEVGVPSNITFLRTTRGSMPMACGLLQPAVIMPAEADAWPADRLRVVLLHELAHVKRRDCLTHALAQLACAVHWFNPLAWIAARQVRTERERACDDLVLAAGTQPPDYADQLLEIARAMRGSRPALLAGASLAMAHRSQLEGRLMAILDPRVPHARLTRLRAAAASVICGLAVVPLAAVQPWQDAPAAAPAPLAASREAVTVATPAPQPTMQAPPGAAQRDAREPLPRGLAHEAARVGITGALAVLPRIDAEQVATSVSATIASELEFEADEQNSQSNERDKDQEKAGAAKGDPRMIAALTAALKDSDKEVRETAMHALVQLRDPAIFAPLVEALKDASPDVREQAVFGLGQMRDRRAVDPLMGALKDSHADVREQAAFALGQMRDRAAVAPLVAALKDVDASVREQVVFALGQIRDPSAVEGLSLAMRDANGEVREQAVFALGQLRDRKAVEPLISALKDADADVREQAAFALGQIRDRAAVEALVIALKDSAANVREQAAFALGQLRDARAIDALTDALKDPQAGVRQQAAFALGQLAH